MDDIKIFPFIKTADIILFTSFSPVKNDINSQLHGHPHIASHAYFHPCHKPAGGDYF